VKRKKEDGEGYEGCPVTEDFDAGDQRRPYLPCPHCGDDEDGVLLQLHRDDFLGWREGETPHFVCPGCGGVIEHRHKADMVRRCHPYRREPGRQHGGWLPTFESKDPGNPAPARWIRARDFERWRARPVEGRQPSYTAWQIVSSAVDWHYVASERRKAETGSEGDKIVYSQQIEGEAYEQVAQQADVDVMLEKRSDRYRRGVVPEGYEQLTCAVDLNGDWAQWTVYGWGPMAEHVPVDKGRIDGSPSEGRLWAEISALMNRVWPHEDGGSLPLAAAGIDSGYGTYYVYAFCRRFARVKALDGAKGWGLMPLRRGPIQKLEGPDGSVVKCRTWRVGTWDLKRTLLNEAIPLGCDGEASASVAGKSHWPMWLEKDFFEELTAEVLVDVQERKTGVVKAEAWVRARRRNEEMDLWVYNAALARSLGIGVPGAEPDWLELARLRRGGQLDLDDLWDRPAHAVREVASDPSADWGWKKRETA
jgi:phage terminase large subunit GpA-like protein